MKEHDDALAEMIWESDDYQDDFREPGILLELLDKLMRWVGLV